MPKSCIISINDKPGQNFAEFSPQSQTVAPGDLINWRNNSRACRVTQTASLFFAAYIAMLNYVGPWYASTPERA